VIDRGVTARHRKSGSTRPRRLAGALGSGAVALLLLAAALLVGPLPAQAQVASREPGTMLRLAQLTPDLPSVELAVSSVMDSRKKVAAEMLHYGVMSAYQAVEPGDYVVTMRPGGSTEPPAVSRTISVQRGTTYTVAAVQHKKTPDDLQVFTDDLTAPPPGQARVRVINAAPPAPVLDAPPVASALPCGQASPYRDVAPGTVDLSVGPPGAPGTPLPVTVRPNQVASIVLTSDAGGPRAMLVVDAGGPAVVPPGPVHAGFGGTAGPAPGAAIGSGVLAVLAAVAAGVSLRLSRRAG
jgi:Domain of unknown function (DUF4397)